MIEPLMPAEKRLGRPRKVDLRAVVEGLLYIQRTACPWRLLPHDFPHRSTVQRYFYAWQADGLWERINFVLVQYCREQASPSGGVIDSQSGLPEQNAVVRAGAWPSGECRITIALEMRT
jgi:transposase